MTKKEALTIAINNLTAVEFAEVRDTLSNMIDKLASAPHRPMTEEQKNARKAKTAAARQELVAKVTPVLRDVLTHTLTGMTAKDIFADAQSRLPADFTAAKVQNVLLREMAPELEKIEAKGKANIYRLK